MATIYDMYEMVNEMREILPTLQNARQWIMYLSGEVGPQSKKQSLSQIDELDEMIAVVTARLDKMVPPKLRQKA